MRNVASSIAESPPPITTNGYTITSAGQGSGWALGCSSVRENRLLTRIGCWFRSELGCYSQVCAVVRVALSRKMGAAPSHTAHAETPCEQDTSGSQHREPCISTLFQNPSDPAPGTSNRLHSAYVTARTTKAARYLATAPVAMITVLANTCRAGHTR